MGEHRPYKPGVAGSNPVPPTMFGQMVERSNGKLVIKDLTIQQVNYLTNNPPTSGGVVQFWLERRPVTPEVASSSLVVPAIAD